MTSSPSRPVREPTRSGLGFDSLFGVLAWGVTLVLLLVAPSQLAGFWPGDFNFWPQALFLLLLAGVAILLAIAPKSAPQWDGVALCLALFLGWNLLATLFASYAHDAWLELARVTGALAFFWIVRAFFAREQKLILVAAAVAGLAWLGAGALLDFAQTRNPRQFGGFLVPNLFANALALALPLALITPLGVWSLTRSRAATALAALPFFVLLPALAVTSSKGGFLAALVGIGATLIVLRAARKEAFGRITRRALPLLLVLGLGFGALAAVTVVPRLLATRGADDNSTMFPGLSVARHLENDRGQTAHRVWAGRVYRVLLAVRPGWPGEVGAPIVAANRRRNRRARAAAAGRGVGPGRAQRLADAARAELVFGRGRAGRDGSNGGSRLLRRRVGRDAGRHSVDAGAGRGRTRTGA